MVRKIYFKTLEFENVFVWSKYLFEVFVWSLKNWTRVKQAVQKLHEGSAKIITSFRPCGYSGIAAHFSGGVSYRVVETPLNHIIERFPLFAGKLYYNMMLVEPENCTNSTYSWKETSFAELDLYNAHQGQGQIVWYILHVT